jgi:putative inorganic carbon (hco3(-)) transporter
VPGVGFFLFLLINAALFIRPAEVLPALAGVPIFQGLLYACLAASLPSVLQQLAPRSLAEQPITACVLGLLAIVVLSSLIHFGMWGVSTSGLNFFQVILYYLLLVSVVDSPARFRTFLFVLAPLILVPTVLALLHHHDVIQVASLREIERLEIDEETGTIVDVRQLRSTGIFSDPNDLSLILLVGIIIGLFWAGDRRLGASRWLAWAPLLVLGFALTETKSRGGFLALLCAIATLLTLRHGWKKALPLATVLLPVLFLFAGGRQTQLSTGADTAQQRIHLWAEGLQMLRRSPLLGIGADQFDDEASDGLVAHNSYVHAFAELGVCGGTLFVGMYYLIPRCLLRLGPSSVVVPDPELERLRPYLIALGVGYAIGLFSLSRDYVIPTYLAPGLAVIYQRLVVATAPDSGPRLDARLVLELAAVGMAALAGLFVFVRLFVR